MEAAVVIFRRIGSQFLYADILFWNHNSELTLESI